MDQQQGTYRQWNHEPGIEVEDRIEESCSNGCELFIGRKGDHHHPIVSESDDQTEDTIEIPQKLGCSPFKEQHGICDERINERLDKNIRYFNHNLFSSQNKNLEQHQMMIHKFRTKPH